MLIRFIIFLFLNFVCLNGFCQTFMVCDVSNQPAAVTYTNGYRVKEGDLMEENKILRFSKNSSIAFMHRKSKEMYFFAGEGQYVVSELIKASKNKVKAKFSAFMKEIVRNKDGFRLAGVIYKNEADSIMDWGASNVKLCDSKANEVKMQDVRKGEVYYFIVSNPTDSMMFVNVVASYAGGEEQLCCQSADVSTLMGLIVPAGAQVLLSDFPQVYDSGVPDGLRVIASSSPIDPQLVRLGKFPLDIISPVENSTVQYPQATLRFRVENVEKISAVEVSVNGAKGQVVSSVVAGLMECRIQLDVYGKNVVKVTAIGKDGLRYSKEMDLYHQRLNKPKLHLLSVGIGDYKNRKLEKLHFAANDASMVYALIDTLCKINHQLYAQEGYRKLLTDKVATRGEILKCLDDIRSEADTEDIVMVYISGHGKVVEVSSKRYFLPYDAEQEPYLESTAISYAELKEKLKVLEDKECKVVVYLDACYAGEMYYTKAANEFIADADPAVIGFYSSTRNEPSLEKKSLGHGVFTYALLNGLKGGAKDGNDNVTITSLGDYISEQVRIETDGRQTPKVDNGGEDFILFRASQLPIYADDHKSVARKATVDKVGNPVAEIIDLAASYYTGEVVPPTEERAYEVYTLAANAGDIKSMYMLGVCYETGKGCTSNITEAIHWYTLSAREGFAASQYNLGSIYYNGKNGSPNLDLAKKWFTEAAIKDYPQAQAALGYLYLYFQSPDFEKAFEWFSKGAENGNAMALYYLGECYMNGYGTPENFAKAKQAWKKSAGLGYKPAQEKLLSIY